MEMRRTEQTSTLMAPPTSSTVTVPPTSANVLTLPPPLTTRANTPSLVSAAQTRPVPNIIAQLPSSMLVRPDKFDGSGSWEDYISHFENAAVINNWVNRKKDFLKFHLSGEARQYINSLDANVRDSYELMCEALEKRFSIARLTSIYQTELSNRVRQLGESLPALGQSIRILVGNAFPDITPSAVEKLAVHWFKEALTNSDQRIRITEEAPKTLEHAIQIAMARETAQISEQRKLEAQQSAIVCAAQAVKPQISQVDTSLLMKLVEKVEALEKRDEERSRRREVICFNCNRPGHIAKFCHNEPRFQGNENRLR